MPKCGLGRRGPGPLRGCVLIGVGVGLEGRGRQKPCVEARPLPPRVATIGTVHGAGRDDAQLRVSRRSETTGSANGGAISARSPLCLGGGWAEAGDQRPRVAIIAGHHRLGAATTPGVDRVNRDGLGHQVRLHRFSALALVAARPVGGTNHAQDLHALGAVQHFHDLQLDWFRRIRRQPRTVGRRRPLRGKSGDPGGNTPRAWPRLGRSSGRR